MKNLKYALLFVPLNVFAHAGHDGLLIRASAEGWFYTVTCLLLTVSVFAGYRWVKNRQGG